ncbi:ankyrin repeat domain-containing protein [Geodermatophilus sp. YIM 151500]|uniref:ankyrin repeat domain-containing protein n=1 Tax=Geodermatophilus sp. YIM 151500 TaxID=2984531 RepID=UPI0021E47A16|nr:ankyrin repeat domain-containing protein [Geodermatophilus sp. YIM 151500]MCV2488729.1 ankyrin repeat domain-containing protein [Geodermatophilus sp. YIM 151500]
MTIRMTAQRLGRLIAAGDADAVRTAVTDDPRLLQATVERDGQGGWTPVHVAVAEGRGDVVRVLAEAGGDLAARTERDRTPLHVALEQAPTLVGLLRELGAVVDAASAAYLDDVDQLVRELDGGAPLADPVTGVDLLSLAAYGGAAEAVRLLLDRGADADGGALHAAAGQGHVDVVRMLLAAGADVDRRDPDTGRSPLHAAVAAGPSGDAPEVVRALLDAGADVNATTADGASAVDISRVAAARSRRDDAGRATGNDALAELLVARGASD